MATLADVNFSLSGEATKKQSPGKTITGMVKYDGETPMPQKDWVIFKLVDNNKKGGVWISTMDDVFNPKTGKVERIRLLSGVGTIWMSEQKDLTPDFVKQNIRSLHFPRGIKTLRISSVDEQAIEFLRVSNQNFGNTKRIRGTREEYYEFDTAAAEREAFAKESLEIKAAIEATQADKDKMKKHAAFLGIRLINDFGEPKSEDGIRMEYVIYAKRNPTYFTQTLGSKQIEVSWLVKSAIMDSRIDIGREPGRAYWANGGGMICQYPTGIDGQQFLIDLANTPNAEGKQFLEQLQKFA